MLQLITFLIIYGLGFFMFRRSLSIQLRDCKNNFVMMRRHSDELNNKLNILKNKNTNLEANFQKKLALSEMTKLISQSLDAEEVFLAFKNNLSQFIECESCNFIEAVEQSDMQKTSVDYFPLRTERGLIGNIVVEGLNPCHQDTMTILATQLNLVFRKISLFKKVQQLSITDSLTGVFNRRYLLHRFNQEFKRSLRYNMDMSTIMIDIDLFKACNDQFGHLVGDVILREVANLIRENIRTTDFLGRYGGEEFLTVLPSTGKGPAYIVAQRIHSAVENHLITAYDESVKVTLSLGLATLSSDIKKAQELLDRSDFALYRAKKTGRNKISIYGIYE